MVNYNSEEIFSADKFPVMAKELSVIKSEIVDIPIYFKAEIIISYLKNHSIKNDWIKANPKLVELLLSNHFVTRCIESLFDFCRMKLAYSRSFETYIRMQLLN